MISILVYLIFSFLEHLILFSNNILKGTNNCSILYNRNFYYYKNIFTTYLGLLCKPHGIMKLNLVLYVEIFDFSIQ